MNNNNRFTYSQIRYIIWMYRLSRAGFGVKNVELAKVLALSKPSVHNMLRSLADLGIVKQESFGLAHLTDMGRVLAIKYEACFSLLEAKMADICGEGIASENAICSILADMSYTKLDELYVSQENKHKYQNF